MGERAIGCGWGRWLPKARALVRITAMAAVLLMAPLQNRALAFSDEMLIEGFVVTVFGTEVDNGDDDEASRVVKKFTGPVRYHLVSTARVDRTRTLRRFMGQLSDTVQNLSLTETADRDEAHMVIFLVDRASYVNVIRATVWDGVDTTFLEQNACSAVIAARLTGIERAFIYLVADEGFVGLSHCMVEEIAQSLGPANDSSALTDSIFNDQSTLNVFGVFDWFILNMLYDARIRPGMSEAEVRPLLPFVMADARRRLPHALSRGNGVLAHEAIR